MAAFKRGERVELMPKITILYRFGRLIIVILTSAYQVEAVNGQRIKVPIPGKFADLHIISVNRVLLSTGKPHSLLGAPFCCLSNERRTKESIRLG